MKPKEYTEDTETPAIRFEFRVTEFSQDKIAFQFDFDDPDTLSSGFENQYYMSVIFWDEQWF